MSGISLRPALATDAPFLWRMLTYAASMPDEDIEHAKTNPELRDYVEGFGRAGDVGVLAVGGDTRVGAAWLRLAPPGATPSATKVWTHELPELALATLPHVRGRGLGTQLLEHLFEIARREHAAVALTVRDASPAVRLYERVGFVVERRITNRVGTMSLVMTRALR